MGLPALRRRQTQLLLAGASLASALLVALIVLLISSAVREVHRERGEALGQTAAALQQLMAQRTHGYKRTARLAQVLWRDRGDALEAWGSPWLTSLPDHQTITVAAPGGVAWQVAIAPPPSQQTGKLLGLVYDASQSARATAAENTAPGSLQAIVQAQNGRFWASTGVPLPAARLAAISAARTLANTVQADAPGPAVPLEPQSWWVRHPSTGRLTLVGRVEIPLPGVGPLSLLELEEGQRVEQGLARVNDAPFWLLSGSGQVLAGDVPGTRPASAMLAQAVAKARRAPGQPVQRRDADQWLTLIWIPQAHAAVATRYDAKELAALLWPSTGVATLTLLGLLAALWLAVWRLHAAVLRPAWRAAQSAYEAERLFRHVIETSPDPLVLLDPRTEQVQYASTSYRRAIDASVAPAQLIHTAQAGDVAGSPSLHLALAGPGGEPRDYEVQASMVRFREAEYLLVALHDITARMQAEAHLREAQAQAQAHSRAKSAFVAHMSHEIRTPLNGLMGHLELLSRSTLSAEQRDRLARMRASADGLLALLGDALDLSKIEANLLVLNTAPVDLVGLIEEVTRAHAGAAAYKGLTLDTFIDPALAGQWQLDGPRLRQVLANLIGNAIKFTDTGFVRLSAHRVEVGQGTDQVQFEVIDTGPGIAPEQWAQVLQPYAQARPGDAGTGLGLALADELIRLAGGQLHLFSPAEGRGQGFSFTWQMSRLPPAPLPLYPVDVAVACETPALADEWMRWLRAWGMQPHLIPVAQVPAVLAQQAWCLVPCEEEWDGPAADRLQPTLIVLHSDGPARPILDRVWQLSAHARDQVRALISQENTGQAEGPPSVAAAARSLHVLVADDHPANRALLSEQLAHLGHTCECVNDGRAALDCWWEGQFDALLTDLWMPEVDGPALASQLRARGVQAPIIALTASAASHDHQRALEAGITHVLIKPYTLVDLAALLARLFPQASATVPATPLAPTPQVIAAFCQASEQDRYVLEDALARMDRAQIIYLCHRIKGALRHIGQAEAAITFDACEALAEQGTPAQVQTAGAQALTALMNVLQMCNAPASTEN